MGSSVENQLEKDCNIYCKIIKYIDILVQQSEMV